MTADCNCPIWGTPATEPPSNGDGRYIDSPRAGGRYFISGTAEEMLKSRDVSLKAYLTTWLIDQRRLGVDCPEVTSDTLKSADAGRPLSIRERADKYLRFLANLEPYPGSGFPAISYEHSQKNFLLALSQIESSVDPSAIDLQRRELRFFGDYLEEQRWIESYDWRGYSQYGLTVPGHIRLTELETIHIPSSRAFIAMWFDASMDNAWEHGIAPAVGDAGYDPVRIDQQEHVNKIDDEIIAEIRRARFVVADFTQGAAGARGGVYYEAGFAHGLDIPVIFTCRADSLDKVHFDTRQYNHIVWRDPEELRGSLKNRIAAVIGDGPNKTAN